MASKGFGSEVQLMLQLQITDVTQARYVNCIKPKSDFFFFIGNYSMSFFLTSGRALTSGDLGRVCEQSRDFVTSKAILCVAFFTSYRTVRDILSCYFMRMRCCKLSQRSTTRVCFQHRLQI